MQNGRSHYSQNNKNRPLQIKLINILHVYLRVCGMDILKKRNSLPFCLYIAAIGKDSRASKSTCERGLAYRKWHLSGPLILRLPVTDASINKEGKH